VAAGRGPHSSTFQLNLSRFSHKAHHEQPLIPSGTCYTAPKRPLNAPPVPLKALTLSRKVDESKPLAADAPHVPAARRPGLPVRRRGWVVQVDPIIPAVKAPGYECLKLNCDDLLSNSAFNFNLRRCTVWCAARDADFRAHLFDAGAVQAIAALSADGEHLRAPRADHPSVVKAELAVSALWLLAAHDAAVGIPKP